MFQLEFSNEAGRFFKKCHPELRERILSKIRKLAEEPVPHDVKRIVGEERVFRIRIGDYRALYEIYWNDGKILIVAVDKRSRVYS